MISISKKKKKDKPFAQKLIPLIISAIVIYTAADILLQVFYNAEISPTLTTCYFTFFGSELVSLAMIKSTKEKHSNTSNTTNDFSSVTDQMTALDIHTETDVNQ